MENMNITNIKLSKNTFTRICMYLPQQNIIEMQNLNVIFYEIIIPRVFIKLNQSIMIY